MRGELQGTDQHNAFTAKHGRLETLKTVFVRGCSGLELNSSKKPHRTSCQTY